jgi:hypothetical protein
MGYFSSTLPMYFKRHFLHVYLHGFRKPGYYVFCISTWFFQGRLTKMKNVALSEAKGLYDG